MFGMKTAFPVCRALSMVCNGGVSSAHGCLCCEIFSPRPVTRFHFLCVGHRTTTLYRVAHSPKTWKHTSPYDYTKLTYHITHSLHVSISIIRKSTITVQIRAHESTQRRLSSVSFLDMIGGNMSGWTPWTPWSVLSCFPPKLPYRKQNEYHQGS